MYSEGTLKIPIPRIKYTPNLSEASIVRFVRNAYIAVGTAGTLAVLLGLLTLFVPRSAIAEWPIFGTPAVANEGLLHDPKLALLKAAVNPDPNPTKGSQLIALSGGAALIPASGVEGTVVEPGSSGNGSVSVYTVRDGDSLSEIAEMFGVSINTILWANDIKDPKTVTPGTTLVILPVSGIQHNVKSGETLASIARKYDADAGDIAAYNGLDAGSGITAGTEIIVPGGRIAIEKPKAKAKTTAKSGAKASAAAKSTTASLGNWGNPLPGGRVSQGIHGYNGVDVSAPSGTPIYAAAGGTIVVAKGGGGYNGGYGNYIVIDHGNGTQTLYAHMSSLAVSGDSVSKGSLIGYVGSTGRSTGNHLHFEVRGAKNPLAR